MINITIKTGIAIREADHGTTKDGKRFVKFGLAVYQGKDIPKMFLNCEVWNNEYWINKAAEIKKGDTVYVVGRDFYDHYTKNDEDRIAHKVMVTTLDIIPKQSFGKSQDDSEGDAAIMSAPTQVAPSRQVPVSSAIDTDDLPF